MHDLLNIALAFLEGLALIISPCILPILPIILSGQLEGGKKRPLGIIVGFIVIFALFTFFSRKLVQAFGIDLNIIRYVSFSLLLLLGLIMVSSYLSAQFNRLTQGLSNVGSSFKTLNHPKGDFFSGILFGGLIAVIWTPCAGPILATVIVQTVLQTSTLSSFFTILAFAVGAAIPMLIIALLGRKAMSKLTFFKQRAVILRKILGAIIILSVLYLILSEEMTLSFNKSNQTSASNITGMQLVEGLTNPYPAPAIDNISQWINSPPIPLSSLRGKVILIDFWAYSCINCLRTLPYLKNWYQKYQDKGLVIIGVHSPEFDFERNVSNVKKAVEKQGIRYPVALDNQFTTWQNYHNRYWPAHYLIDQQGRVVYEHFGEGNYESTENNIRYLLGYHEAATKKKDRATSSKDQTPETYLGYQRASSFASPEPMVKGQITSYTYPQTLPQNDWALQGEWTIAAEKIVSAQANARIKIHFQASKVFAVIGSLSNHPAEIKLFLNGKPLNQGAGEDVINSKILVKEHTLYKLIDLAEPTNAELEIWVDKGDVAFYTFTFGN